MGKKRGRPPFLLCEGDLNQTTRQCLSARIRFAIANIIFSFTPSEISVSDYMDLWTESYCKFNCKPTTYSNYEKKSGYISSPPLAVKTRSAPHVYLTPEQMEIIFKRFPEGTSSYLPLLLGYKCGLRLGEAFGLTWDCIDFEAKTLTVDKQLFWHERSKDTGAAGYWYFSSLKYNSVRTIEISADVVDVLTREKTHQDKAPTLYEELYTHNYRGEYDHLNTKGEGEGEEIQLVMRRLDGTHIISRNMQYVSQVATHELGYAKFDYHSLRHTHATILAEKVASPKYVQHRLGHKNIQVTMQIY